MNSLVGCLSRAERDRTYQYASLADARRFAVAWAWVRHVVAGEVGTSARDVRFPTDETGPRFDLAYAGQLALIAVADFEVGVGLAVRPDSVELHDLPPGWTVRELGPAPGYIGAVTAPGGDWDARLRHVLGPVGSTR
jgi:phosphopantetheinyl transferase